MKLLAAVTNRLTAAGLVLGVTIGLVAGRLLESRLHGVSRTDVWSFIFGAAILMGVAVVASLLPARGRRGPTPSSRSVVNRRW